MKQETKQNWSRFDLKGVEIELKFTTEVRFPLGGRLPFKLFLLFHSCSIIPLIQSYRSKKSSTTGSDFHLLAGKTSPCMKQLSIILWKNWVLNTTLQKRKVACVWSKSYFFSTLGLDRLFSWVCYWLAVYFFICILCFKKVPSLYSANF